MMYVSHFMCLAVPLARYLSSPKGTPNLDFMRPHFVLNCTEEL